MVDCISACDLNNILKAHGFNPKIIEGAKMEMLRIGCQLHTLRLDDVLYIAREDVSIYAAQRRLTQCRVKYL